MVSSHKVLAVFLMCLSSISLLANGQEPASKNTRLDKPTPKLFHFATNESIQRIIDCSSEQAEAMQKLKKKLRQEVESLREEAVALARQEVPSSTISVYVESEMNRISDNADRWVDEVLYPKQGDRLKAIYLARKGARSFGDRWLQDELNLTAKQSNLVLMEILRLSDAVRVAKRQTMNADSWTKTLSDLDKEFQSRIVNRLSVEQQSRINEIRAGFELEHTSK